VIRWRKNWGQYVGAFEPLIEVRFDGVGDFVVRSPASGVLTELYTPPGTSVKVGQLLGQVTKDPTTPRALPPGEQYPLEPLAELEESDRPQHDAPSPDADDRASVESQADNPPLPPEADDQVGVDPTVASKKPSTPAGKVKVSFNLWPEEVARLRDIARRRRSTVTAALQRAIADEMFLTIETDKGAHVLLKYPGGEYREVIMHQ
jgi:pyruvate/2-oxoglutarate dehydrogenase complex dihydrolipoamide acyltransferase (E2) component